MSDSGQAVFLSYASQDAEAAQRVCGALRAAGIEIWFDQNELVGGDAWDRKIREQIKACALFVPVISAATQARREGYFRLEWKLAEDRSHLMAKGIPFIVPVAIDATTERGALVPDAFLSVQWTKLPGGEAPAAFVARVQKLLGASSPESPMPARPLGDGSGKFAPGLVAGAPKGIVVLPFGNLSPDPENEFFADGLTEEVIADLSAIRALRVISRTSAMRFKGSALDLRTIARELHVRYVLEGSVRRAGSSLRVTAQLIEADTDSHLWAEKYSGSVDDVFAIQEEISRKIVKALHVQLTDAESRVVALRPIDNVAAYDCYLQAHREMFRFTPAALDRAEQLVDAALALTGENPLLLATRGLVSWYFVNFSIRPEERYLDEAASFAARALAQDPDFFLGIFLRGLVAAKHGDLEVAVRDIRKANDLRPGDPTILAEWVRHIFCAGQEENDLGQAVMERHLQAEMFTPLAWSFQGWAYQVRGRLVEAEHAARRGLALADRGNPAKTYAAYALALLGHREEAVAIFGEVESTLGSTPYGSLSAFLARALQGDRDGAVAHVTPLLEQSAHWVELLALFLADGYALIGRRDDALRWLRKAVDCGFINHRFLAVRDPFLESLRGDVEYEALMQQVKQRWQAFKG